MTSSDHLIPALVLFGDGLLACFLSTNHREIVQSHSLYFGFVVVAQLLFKTPNSVMEKLLEEIYYDPSQPGSFSGVESIYRAAVERGRKIPRRKIQD